MQKLLTRIALLVLPLLIILVVSVFLLNLGSIGTFFSGVFFLATALNEYAGLNIWLARAVTAPIIFVAYFFGVRYILFERQKQMWGWTCLVAVWSLICVALFFSQGSFSRQTGEALQFYFKDDRGQIVLRDHSGVDAKTGQALHPVTPEIMRLYRLQHSGVLEISEETLFDPLNGKPLKRYYEAPDGTITIFPMEVQYHPEYGVKLEVLTLGVAERIQAQRSQSPAAKIKRGLSAIPDRFRQGWQGLRTLEAQLIDLILQTPSKTVQFDPSSAKWTPVFENTNGQAVEVQISAEGQIKQGNWSVHDVYGKTWKYGWDLMPGERLPAVPGPRDEQYAYMCVFSIHSDRQQFIQPAAAPQTLSGQSVPVVDGKFIPLVDALRVTLQPGQRLVVIWNDKFEGMQDNEGPVTFTLTIRE
jgi:hypothetical protein